MVRLDRWPESESSIRPLVSDAAVPRPKFVSILLAGIRILRVGVLSGSVYLKVPGHRRVRGPANLQPNADHAEEENPETPAPQPSTMPTGKISQIP